MNNFIKNKRVLSLSVVFAVLFMCLICLSLNALKQQAIDINKKNLQILANEKAMQVNMFLDSLKEKFNIISTGLVFEEVVKDPDNPVKIELAKKRINELKHVISRIAVFTKAGVMFIAESGPVPKDYSAIPYFSSKDKEIIFMRYYDEYQKRDYYSILGPIYDSIEKDKVIGSIAFDVELDKISNITKETFDWGENIEVYLIDESGLLLSNSKYIGDNNKKGVLIQEIKSQGAKNCLECLKKHYEGEIIEKHEDEIMRYKNYMGDEVYGVHAHIPAIRGCVIAEKSADEITKISLIDYIKKLLNK